MHKFIYYNLIILLTIMVSNNSHQKNENKVKKKDITGFISSNLRYIAKRALNPYLKNPIKFSKKPYQKAQMQFRMEVINVGTLEILNFNHLNFETQRGDFFAFI